MLTTLVLQSLLAGVAVDAVSADQQPDGVSVDLQTSEPVSDGMVRGLVGPRRLYLFVTGASGTDLALGTGAEKLLVRQRPQYLKLELPLAAGTQCEEPARLTATPTGMHVRFACRSKETPSPPPEPRNATAADKKSRELLHAALTLPDEQAFAPEPAATPAPDHGAKMHDEPRVAAHERSREMAPVAAADPPAEGSGSETGTATPEEAGSQKSNGGAASVPPTVASEPDPASTSAPPSADVAGKHVGPAAAASWLAPVLALLFIAAFALAWTRRRKRRQGIIQIVESATIGPKRSLLVAKVGNRTLILGASEAGITLLETLAGETANAAPSDTPAAEASMAAPTASPPEPQPRGGEESLLRRLFGRRDAAHEAREAAEFRALLDEPVADEELRRKLERGLGARVS